MKLVADPRARTGASTSRLGLVEVLPADDPAVVAALGGELDGMALATHYRDWLFAAAEPFLGQRVLEVGAGIGTMTECVAERELVVALEYTRVYADRLRERFAANPRVQVVEGDVTDAAMMSRLGELGIDSAMSFNVLEHVEDDAAALRCVRDALAPGGCLVALVPACPGIYGTMDRAVGHHRRYTRRELGAKVRRAGFEIVELYHINLLGYFLWLARGRVLRTANITGTPRALRAFDGLVVPPLRALESRWRPPFGQSLLLVARRLVEARRSR